MHPVVFIGPYSISTYLLIISLTYCALLLWVTFQADRMVLERQTALDLSLAIMVGGFVGARLLHVIYEEPLYYIEHPDRIIKFWQGGFVFYGGVIGAFLASEWLIRRRKLERGRWQDLFTPVFPLGYALGRLGCFAAGCCFGQPSSVSWAVSFPKGVEAPPFVLRHPTQLYAFAWEFFVFLLLLLLLKYKPFRFLKISGSILYFWFLLHGIGRIGMEQLRADHRGAEFAGLSISTWISIVLILISLAKLAHYQKREKRAS